jgi:hypothetical protein
LVRSVSVTETEWDDEQRAWMLALGLYRAGLCPNCGRAMDECTASESEGKYHVGPPARCHATTALSIAQAAYRDAPQAEALLWRAEKR